MLNTIPVTELTEKQRRNFSCGVDALDTYFKQYSKGNHIKNIGKTFVLLDDKAAVIGYYTTSMGSVNFNTLPKEISARLPKYPIPVALLARLGVDVKKQGQGWGEFLLMDALNRIRDAASVVAACDVVVDAKDEKAKTFYTKFGFISLADNNFSLFLSIDSIPKK